MAHSNKQASRIVLVGGGHTHSLVLHALRQKPFPNAAVTVINPGPTAPYSGMLPGFVAGHYLRAELDIDIAQLCDELGARFIDGRAVAMARDAQTVLLEDGTALPYDLVSFDVGITSAMPRMPGFADYAVPAKPLGIFAEKWDAYRKAAGVKSVAVIGGGIAGAELAMAMAYALHQRDQGAHIRLIDRSSILSDNSETARKNVRAELDRNGVEVIENAPVREIVADGVLVEDGTKIDAEFIVGAAGATPHPWIAQTGLDLHNGYIKVDKALRASAAGVYAVGDCAHLVDNPRPKAGVYAVREAPVLFENLHHALAGTPQQDYVPQSDYLKLVSLGGKRAFGEKFGIGLSGALIWRLKDYIDRKFMNQF